MTVTAVAQRKEAKRVGAEHGQADQADLQRPTLHVPVHPVRFVTAAALFDGHDAAINIMRRILQAQGAEVVHLGHDRSVRQVADAVLEEDAQGVAVSSYQGGHVEYFEFLAATLKAAGAGDVRIFGGGGGVIVPEEIARLNAAGVKIFSPEDGQRLGLTGMINELIRDCDTDLTERPPSAEAVLTGDRSALARAITCLQAGRLPDGDVSALTAAAASRRVPVLGITGTGGSGKSSLTDELVRRFRTDQNDKLRVAVLAVDPTRRRGGGALLGDRIRMNALDGERVFFRSLATRGARELPENMEAIIAACQAASYDLVIVETPGIGQGDAGVTGLADVALYVMTPEFGAASQLEKIDMLDFADVVAINKFERRGGADALRDVSRQLIRNRGAFGARPDDMPVFGTSAATFNDNGVTALYQHLAGLLEPHGLPLTEGVLPPATGRVSTDAAAIIPPARAGYLGEIAAAVRGFHEQTEKQVAAVRRVQRLADVRAELLGGIERTGATQVPNPTLNPATTATPTTTATPATSTTSTSPTTPTSPAEHAEHAVAALLDQAAADVTEDSAALIKAWPAVVESYSGDEQVVKVRDRELHTKLTRESLSGSKIPRVALPRYADHGELLRFLREENLPGYFPFTAGVFPFKREGEDPARMFAGEGDPFRTNRRFKLVSEGQPATRLSTAFDSVTLYGRDPGESPDVYGKVGTSGVSIATLDDMKVLYDGFDLASPTTSVSMTINGPAPTILAYFLNTAIDQGLDAFAASRGRRPTEAEAARDPGAGAGHRARHRAGGHPQGGPGPEHLHLLDRVQPADDGRHPGVVHRQPGPQLLLGVDLRLPHRRGRGQPDQPARVHPRQRVHLRRVLPRPGHEHRRLRAEPVVLLLQRDGPRVHRDGPGRPADLGGRDARPLRRQRPVAEAEVPRADLRPVAARPGDELQRHPHHPAGALRDLRQLQQPAHQRL